MSDYNIEPRNITAIPKNIEIAFITADFNKEYTSEMEQVAEDYLHKNYFKNISKFYVPGAFEIPAMLERILKDKKFDLIYCFGVVIRWGTTHYDMVAWESARGITDVSLKYKTPIINAILTCENQTQVEERINTNTTVSGLNLLSEVLKHNLW